MVEETLNPNLMCDVYRQQVMALQAENTKLKKLLEESRFLLGKTPCENMSQCLTFTDVMNRIDQVLGEE